MTIKPINVGNVVNDGSGDDLRTAFVKVNDNFVELDIRHGEQNTASNVGTGTGLYKDKVGVNLEFKSINAGTGIELISDDNTITIGNVDDPLVIEINSTISDYDLGTLIQRNIDLNDYENTIFLKWLKETIVMDMGSFANPSMTAGGLGGGSGVTGYRGSAGIVGYQGSSGSVGYQGSSGSVGYQGSSGSVGYQGSSGSVGYKGSSGSVGYKGSAGDQGPVGYAGSAGSGGGGGLLSRTTKTVTSTSLANGGSGTYTITGFKGYMLYSIQTTAAAWVTIYTSIAARTLDSSRGQNTDPTPGSGIIAEAITTGSQIVKLTPGTIGYSDETSPSTDIPIKITNLSGGSTTITVTLTLVCLEV
jgi:hypothetical protein